MEAVALLCDFAEEVNGKLYIMGGAWSEVRGPAPINCAIGVRLATPWNKTNEKHDLAVRLITEDGAVAEDLNDNRIEATGEFEVGRPPGSLPGNEIVSAFAFQFQGLVVDTGAYRFGFFVDDTELASARFRVLRPPGWKVEIADD